MDKQTRPSVNFSLPTSSSLPELTDFVRLVIFPGMTIPTVQFANVSPRTFYVTGRAELRPLATVRVTMATVDAEAVSVVTVSAIGRPIAVAEVGRTQVGMLRGGQGVGISQTVKRHDAERRFRSDRRSRCTIGFWFSTSGCRWFVGSVDRCFRRTGSGSVRSWTCVVRGGWGGCSSPRSDTSWSKGTDPRSPQTRCTYYRPSRKVTSCSPDLFLPTGSWTALPSERISSTLEHFRNYPLRSSYESPEWIHPPLACSSAPVSVSSLVSPTVCLEYRPLFHSVSRPKKAVVPDLQEYRNRQLENNVDESAVECASIQNNNNWWWTQSNPCQRTEQSFWANIFS